jgi:hypothetical protein
MEQAKEDGRKNTRKVLSRLDAKSGYVKDNVNDCMDAKVFF